MRSCKKQSEQPKSLRVALGWPCAPKRFLVEFAGTVWYECNISMQCAPLWNILNIYKEWMGTSWPYVQLQEAIRTAKVFEGCSGLALRPRLRVSFQICGSSLVEHAECFSQHSHAVLAPLKHSECLQGMSGGQLTICAAARSNQNGQSVWALQWVGLAPKLKSFLSNLWDQSGSCSNHMYVFKVQHFNTAGALWNILNINICKEWVGTSWPYVQLQEAIRTAKVFESCSGLAMRSSLSVSFQICGNSLVATAYIWMFDCNIACSARP